MSVLFASEASNFLIAIYSLKDLNNLKILREVVMFSTDQKALTLKTFECKLRNFAAFCPKLHEARAVLNHFTKLVSALCCVRRVAYLFSLKMRWSCRYSLLNKCKLLTIRLSSSLSSMKLKIQADSFVSCQEHPMLKASTGVLTATPLNHSSAMCSQMRSVQWFCTDPLPSATRGSGNKTTLTKCTQC